jgi:hypothetical protein
MVEYAQCAENWLGDRIITRLILIGGRETDMKLDTEDGESIVIGLYVSRS